MREAYTEQIATTISAPMLARLDAAAKNDASTRAAFVRRLIARALAEATA